MRVESVSMQGLLEAQRGKKRLKITEPCAASGIAYLSIKPSSNPKRLFRVAAPRYEALEQFSS